MNVNQGKKRDTVVVTAVIDKISEVETPSLLHLETTMFLHSILFQVLDSWNKGELESFLIEITRDIMKYKDTDGSPLVEKIRDSAGQKGTGKWTAISSLEYGVPVTLIGQLLLPGFSL